MQDIVRPARRPRTVLGRLVAWRCLVRPAGLPPPGGCRGPRETPGFLVTWPSDRSGGSSPPGIHLVPARSHLPICAVSITRHCGRCLPGFTDRTDAPRSNLPSRTRFCHPEHAADANCSTLSARAAAGRPVPRTAARRAREVRSLIGNAPPIAATIAAF